MAVPPVSMHVTCAPTVGARGVAVAFSPCCAWVLARSRCATSISCGSCVEGVRCVVLGARMLQWLALGLWHTDLWLCVRFVLQFPQIPHYHLVEATEAAKKVMGPYYRCVFLPSWVAEPCCVSSYCIC